MNSPEHKRLTEIRERNEVMTNDFIRSGPRLVKDYKKEPYLKVVIDGIVADQKAIALLLAICEVQAKALEYYAETDNWPYAKKGGCPGEKAQDAQARVAEMLDGVK